MLKEVEARSILTPSKLPGADYVINPYSGCLFGCVYCYADFTRRFTGHSEDKWGDYLDVRVNTPELLEKELEKVYTQIINKRNKYKSGELPVILISSVTDPYQPPERKYQLTRKVLEILRDSNFPGEISILTKSPLVLRDVDLLKSIRHTNVGITITSYEDEVSMIFEKGAPPASERLKALKELNEKGLETYAFVGPLLPNFAARKDKLDILFKQIADTGNKTVWVEHLNLSGPKMERLTRLVGDKLGPSIMKNFVESQEDRYKEQLNSIVVDLIEKYELDLTGGDVIDHRKL